jgi:hypothetical protein
MRKIMLVVASVVALGAATMTTGALGADQPLGSPGLNQHFAFRHGYYIGPGYVAVTDWASWYHREHFNDDCWDGRRWVLTQFGWSWQACFWP